MTIRPIRGPARALRPGRSSASGVAPMSRARHRTPVGGRALSGREAPLKFTPRLATAAGALAVGLVTAGTAAAVQASPALTAPSGPEAIKALVSKSADSYVASRPSVLHAGADEAFVQRSVTAYGGAQFVSYDRTYKGVPVVGGDFVVMTDSAGNAKYTSVAQTKTIGNLSITPTLSKAAAEKVARSQLKTVSNVEGSRLVVNSLGATPALNWETTLAGTGAEGYSRLTVDVDAVTGKV